ncbi:unnamed protein product [Durusdinium trenchii]|uniref:Uncharacterized protein n=1 Tax=Durusdinium trenchii TaxID=1381693 RepID=A0ABP0SGR9_9DINO
MMTARRVCLVALALGGIRAETENASCEPLALLQHQANHDQNHPCAEGVHLCRLREAVQRAPDGTQIDQKWEATRWEWDPALGQKKVGSPHAIQNRRIIAMVEAIRSYGTALSSQLAKKEREVEEMQKLKNLPNPWISFFLEMGLGALFGPVSGALSRIPLIENLNPGTAQDMMKYDQDNVNDMLVTFHKSSAKDFLNSMGQEFRLLASNLTAHLSHFTEEELYSLYISYAPEVASQAKIKEMVDSAFDVWDTQVNGLGWHTETDAEKRQESEWNLYNYWEGIAEVKMDIVPDGGWLEDHPKHSEDWKKLLVNPYARVRNEGTKRFNSGKTYPPEFVAAVDEWTYPGLKDAEGVPRPKVPKSYLGTWSGPVFSRKNCDGQCCQTVDVCDCPTCKQSSLSVSFSEIFNLNKQGNKPGEECSSDGDCMTKACAWSGKGDSLKKRCCVDEDSYAHYGFEGFYCKDQPNGWACDEDVVCAEGLRCLTSGSGHSVCTEPGSKLKAGGLCHDQDSLCETGKCSRVGSPNWEWQCCVSEDDYASFGFNQWCVNQQVGYPCDVKAVCARGLECKYIPPTKGGYHGMKYSCQLP